MRQWSINMHTLQTNIYEQNYFFYQPIFLLHNILSRQIVLLSLELLAFNKTHLLCYLITAALLVNIISRIFFNHKIYVYLNYIIKHLKIFNINFWSNFYLFLILLLEEVHLAFRVSLFQEIIVE